MSTWDGTFDPDSDVEELRSLLRDKEHVGMTIRAGMILLCFVVAGIMIGNAVPVTHTTYRQVVDQRTAPPAKIVYREKIKLVNHTVKMYNPTDACTGKMPVRVEHTYESEIKGGSYGTWTQVTPVGYLPSVICFRAGAYSQYYTKGKVILMFGEEVQ